MPLPLPRRAEREYIAISGITAVYVAARPRAPPLVRRSRDLLHSELAIRQKCPGARIVYACWIDDRSEARLIVRELNLDPAKLTSADVAIRQLENVAAHMAIALTEHDVVLRRAAAAVKHIEAKIAEQQASGELRWFNRMFRQWRIDAKKCGKSMSYAEARARLRRNMFHAVIGRSEQAPMVFPPLPT
jgi:hypothetical protein